MLYTLDLSSTTSRNVTLHSPGFPIGVALTEVVSVADASCTWKVGQDDIFSRINRFSQSASRAYWSGGDIMIHEDLDVVKEFIRRL